MGMKPDTLSQRFGRNLKAARVRMGMTQCELARRIKMTQVQISYLENGHSSTTFATLEKLAGALRVEVWELFK